MVAPDEGCQIVLQLLGLPSGRRRHEDDRGAAQLGHRSQRESAGGLGNDDDGVVGREQLGDGSLAGKQAWQ